VDPCFRPGDVPPLNGFPRTDALPNTQLPDIDADRSPPVCRPAPLAGRPRTDPLVKSCGTFPLEIGCTAVSFNLARAITNMVQDILNINVSARFRSRCSFFPLRPHWHFVSGNCAMQTFSDGTVSQTGGMCGSEVFRPTNVIVSSFPNGVATFCDDSFAGA